MLDGSVPQPELEAMIDSSYELVVNKLTRAQREAVGAIAGSEAVE